MFWDHPTLERIKSKLISDGHTGASGAQLMRVMQRIRQKGWETIVKEDLAEIPRKVGVLHIAQHHAFSSRR